MVMVIRGEGGEGEKGGSFMCGGGKRPRFYIHTMITYSNDSYMNESDSRGQVNVSNASSCCLLSMLIRIYY